MAVVCGNCTQSLGRAHGCQIKHETLEEVRDCYARRYNYEAYYDEGPCCSLCDAPGHGYPGGGPCPLEMRGVNDTYAEEDWERARGVISFEEAYADAMAGV